MKVFSKTSELSKMVLKEELSYSGSTWASMAVSILSIMITYYVWMAVYGDRTVMHGIGKNQMSTYVILSGVLLPAVQWGLNLMMSYMIGSGQISIELLRPLDFQLAMFSERVGGFLSYFLIQCVPVIAVSALLFGMSPPKSFLCGALFLVSLVMALAIAFCLEFWIGMVSFYTNSAWGLQHMKEAILFFTTGAFIPMAFFPSWLKAIVTALPFKDMVYTPVSLYMGIVTGEKAARALLFQLAWLLALMVLSRLFYRTAIKKVTVQGG